MAKVSVKQIKDALRLATRDTFRAFHADVPSHNAELDRVASELKKALERTPR